MADRMHELAGNLALGPQRLMEIARALCTDPALLLLDEPAAGLRHKEKQALADVLRQLQGEGMSILLVEHDMDFVMGLTDRIVVMEFGTKLIEGTPRRGAGQPGGARRLPRARSTEMATRPSSKSATCTPATAAPRCCTASTCELRARPGRHRDRPQRRRQVDHCSTR